MNIFKNVTAEGGISGVNAAPEYCITSGDNRDRASDPERLLADWDGFFSDLTAEEISGLMNGTASAELAFELLMLENSAGAEKHLDR